MVVYAYRCKCCDMEYVGKTQVYLKTRTQQHIGDVWKVIEAGRFNFGPDWWGTGGYSKADAFSKHFANHCRDCKNSNEVKARMKEIMEPRILWQGDRIQCMKSSRTMQCKLCMVERTEILHRFRTDKSKIMNDNSDIFASCKCNSRFHKFARVENTTLRTRMTQKKVTSTRQSKQRRSRFSFNLNSPSLRSTNRSPPETPITPEPASPPVTPVFLLDTNIPGLPYRTPTANPTNLELAQVRAYHEMMPVFEV